jgi:hypothetical protein
MQNTISVSPVRIVKFLLTVTFLLLVFHMVAVTIGYVDPVPPESTRAVLVNNFYQQFHLASKANMSTYFSSLLLGFASLLLYVIYKTETTKKANWLLLSLIFLFLSIDESSEIHENFAGPVGDKIRLHLHNTSMYLAWAWVIPYAAITLFVGLYFLRFTLQLPRKTKNLFFLSGTIYVFAALFLEFFEAHFEEKYGVNNSYNEFLYPCEETLEMVGIILFIYALLDYLSQRSKNIPLSFVIRWHHK